MGLTTYPAVHDEHTTIAKLAEGYSLSRHGDGEVKLAHGGEYVREKANMQLATELQAILAHPDHRCLVAIPTLNKLSPKYNNWVGRAGRFLPLLSEHVTYYSAFCSRPDSAPWIANQDYAQSVQKLWEGKKVALLSEQSSKLVTVVPHAARKTVHIPCVSHGAYAHIDEYERALVRGNPDIVILSCGPTASCLAHRLACRDIQALDLGSIGGMLARLLPIERLHHAATVVLTHPACIDSEAVRERLEASGFTVHYCGEKT